MAARGNGSYEPKGQKLYDWGDGKGKAHSRPKRTAGQLEAAKDRKRQADPSYFSGPMSLADVLREGARADELRYGGVQSQLGLQQQQIPAWFQDYKDTLLTPQQVQAQYQPTIQQSEAVAQETAKPLGLEGPAGEQDQLAAKAREALVNLGTAQLQNAQQADTTYFQGRQGVAQAAQIGAQTQNTQALTDLAGQRGAFRDQYVSDARDRERKYGLDLRHQAAEDKAFDLDVAEAAGVNPLTGKKLPPKDKKDVITSGPFAGYTKGEVRRMDPAKKDRLRKRASQGKPGEPKYGVDADKWAKMTPEQRKAAKDAWEAGGKSGAGLSPSERRQRRKDKEERQRRDSFIESAVRNPPTYPKGHPKAGQTPTRAEVIDQLVKKGYSKEEVKKVLRRLYGTVKRPSHAPTNNGQQRPT